jgi:hypothetical protein
MQQREFPPSFDYKRSIPAHHTPCTSVHNITA